MSFAEQQVAELKIGGSFPCFPKFKSFFVVVPLVHKPQSPLLSENGQRLWPLLLGLPKSCFLIAAVKPEYMCVDEDLPKRPLEAMPRHIFCVFQRMCAKSLQSCLTPREPMTVAYQAPLSMGFFKQEYWHGLPCPPPGDLADPGIKPAPLVFLGLAGNRKS